MDDNYDDLIGEKFGKLTVISKTRNIKGRLAWECKCECGNNIVTVRNALVNGKTRSCGCLKKGIHKKHGHANDKFYRVHQAMVKRCKNPNDRSYKNYGGRGITVCDEWLGESGFINFYNWTINNGYEDGLTLDRKDNDGGYSPHNCRWVNNTIQSRNKRVEKISTTGISGVQERKDKGDYRVVITADGKRYSLGCYKNIEDAKEARKQGELEYWGFTNIKD